MRTSLSGVVGRRVRLVKAGREFKACCPFHNEKSASFYVNDDKGFYHCFGCGAHGDVISFAMRIDGLEFREASELLAREAGLSMPAPSPQARAEDAERQRLFACLTAADTLFQQALRPGTPAHAYATKIRGLSPEAIARWGLGFAGGDVVITALRAKGFSNDELLQCGLIARRPGESSVYPFFRNRLVFPIRDLKGRTIAFGGRAMSDDVNPKYINSPAGPLFDKGRVLFGADIARARAGARDARGQRQAQRPLVVAEGYFDVVALDALGYRAVAPNGTALSEAHLVELWRLDSEPVLCFDGDRAGLQAMGRAIERALPLAKAFSTIKLARLNAGDDPDSALREGRAQDIHAPIAAAQSLSDALFGVCAEGLDLQRAEDRARCEALLREKISTMGDESLKASFEAVLVWDGLRRRLRVPRVLAQGQQGAYGQQEAQGQKGLRSFEGVSQGGKRWPLRAAPTTGPLPSLSGMALQARADMIRGTMAALCRNPDLAASFCEAASAVAYGWPGMAALLGDREAYLQSDEALLLLGDEALCRRVPFARPDCPPIEVQKGLARVQDQLVLECYMAELSEAPATDDAHGWSVFLEKARQAAELRSKLADSGDEDENR